MGPGREGPADCCWPLGIGPCCQGSQPQGRTASLTLMPPPSGPRCLKGADQNATKTRLPSGGLHWTQLASNSKGEPHGNTTESWESSVSSCGCVVTLRYYSNPFSRSSFAPGKSLTCRGFHHLGCSSPAALQSGCRWRTPSASRAAARHPALRSAPGGCTKRHLDAFVPEQLLDLPVLKYEIMPPNGPRDGEPRRGPTPKPGDR